MAIVGYMGSGKTTVGRLLARKLGWEFVDLDRVVSATAGMTIPEIFAHHGEERFRDLEYRALAEALDGGRERVISCGGGAIMRPENRAELRKAATVFLEEDLEVLFSRTRGAGRPLRSASREQFDRLYATRLPYYREVADLEVPVGKRWPGEIAGEVARWMGA